MTDNITLRRADAEQIRQALASGKRLYAALAALDAALAEPDAKREPVAWIVTDKDGKVRKFLTAPLGFGVSELVRFDGDTMSPLYAGDTVCLDYIKEDKT